MKLFINNIQNSGGVSFSADVSVVVPGHYRSGLYILGPMCIEFNGNYYGTGQSTLDTGEKGIIWKWNPTTEVFTHDEIYGTFSVAEDIQHRMPSIIFDGDGYIYATATDPHVSTIRVYKSDSPEDITAFTEVSDTGAPSGSVGKSSYPSLYIYNNELIISHRNTGVTVQGGSDEEFTHSIWRSELNNWNWSRQTLLKNTDSASRNVIYPTFPVQIDENNEWQYLLASPRAGDQGTEEYYAQTVLKTQDWETFYNLEGTWSKDIPLSGAITEAERSNVEIQNEGIGKGVGLQMVSIVNDVFVGYYYDWDNSKHYIQWYDGTWHTKDVQTLLNPLYGYDGGVDGIYKIGNYYYISIINTSSIRKIYKTSPSFESFEEVLNLGDDGTNGRGSVVFPLNVIEETKSLLIGSRGQGESGVFYEIDIKYNIVTFS